MSKKTRSQDSNYNSFEKREELSIAEQEDILDHYRKAGELDVELFGDYDAYEAYDINTKKVSKNNEDV
tara:strand:+ start:444 stop:647 length:204 start_codon:yes stop_codon:yes gene_type:complete